MVSSSLCCSSRMPLCFLDPLLEYAEGAGDGVFDVVRLSASRRRTVCPEFYASWNATNDFSRIDGTTFIRVDQIAALLTPLPLGNTLFDDKRTTDVTLSLSTFSLHIFSLITNTNTSADETMADHLFPPTCSLIWFVMLFAPLKVLQETLHRKCQPFRPPLRQQHTVFFTTSSFVYSFCLTPNTFIASPQFSTISNTLSVLYFSLAVPKYAFRVQLATTLLSYM